MIAVPGLNVGNGGHLIGGVLADVRAFGYKVVRVDCQDVSLTDTPILAQEIIDAGLQPLIIVRHAEQIETLPAGCLVEVGNEPDLPGVSRWDARSYYAAAVACVETAQRTGHRLYVGAVSNLNGRGLGFLDLLPWATWPVSIGCSFHRYPNGAWASPHRPSHTRLEELARLRAIVEIPGEPDRPLACTEVGYHSRAYTDGDAADNLCHERAWMGLHGVELVCAYQLNDGPSPADIDHYGARRMDGTWKPWAGQFPMVGLS